MRLIVDATWLDLNTIQLSYLDCLILQIWTVDDVQIPERPCKSLINFRTRSHTYMRVLQGQRMTCMQRVKKKTTMYTSWMRKNVFSFKKSRVNVLCAFASGVFFFGNSRWWGSREKFFLCIYCEDGVSEIVMCFVSQANSVFLSYLWVHRSISLMSETFISLNTISRYLVSFLWKEKLPFSWIRFQYYPHYLRKFDASNN